MEHKRVTDEILELAALYALGALEPQKAKEFEDHVKEGCAICESELRVFRETASMLPAALPGSRPHPKVRERVLAAATSAAPETGPQIWKSWKAPSPTGLHIVRRHEGAWMPTGLPGVFAKQLYVDPARDTVTMLVRMEPGSSYPPHRHGGPEECLVVEGDLRVGDVVLQAGDYQCAAGDSIHDVSTTVNGCILLIVSSQYDELLPRSVQ
jgi:anti-sigma factor ChrR (cupin superfamily)